MRVELAVSLDLGEALSLERGRELAVHQPHALFELGLLVLLRRLERPLEVVHDRQQLLHEPLGSPGGQTRLLARGALLVVVELGREPLQVVQMLLRLRLGRGELVATGSRDMARDPVALLDLVELFLGRIRHQEVFASSSPISASSITSSSEAAAPSPSPGGDEACCCALAWA